VRRKYPAILLIASLLVTSFYACTKEEEKPAETGATSPTPSENNQEAPAESLPGDPNIDLLSLNFLPSSTWWVATARQPSTFTKLLKWKTVIEHVPMDWVFIQPDFLDKLGLDLEGPAGFALADLEPPGFLLFASRIPESSEYKSPFPSLISGHFPAAKTTQEGPYTRLSLEKTKAFPMCPCEVVLTNTALFTLFHPEEETRNSWVANIQKADSNPAFLDAPRFASLKEILSTKAEMATYVDLAPLIEQEAANLQSSIKATYNHAQDALEKVRREGGTPDVIAHWEKQVEKEEKWLADNEVRYENEAAFFRTVYGSISSVTVGLDLDDQALRFQADVQLKTDSLLSGLFPPSKPDIRTSIAPETHTPAVVAGHIDWTTLLEIIRRGMAADRTASEAPWTIDDTLKTWLESLSPYPFQAHFISSANPNEDLFSPEELAVKAQWGPIEESKFPALIAGSESLPGTPSDAKDVLRNIRFGDVEGELRREEDMMVWNTPPREPARKKASLPAGAKELLSRPNQTFQALVHAGWLVAPDFKMPSRAHSPRTTKFSDALWKEIQSKESQIHELEKQSISVMQANLTPSLKALGWMVFQLESSENKWRVEGGQFLNSGNVEEQMIFWLQLMEPPGNPEQKKIDRQIRTLRREIRLLKLRGEMPKGEADSIRSLPVMPATP